jgi:predicted dehydrogenase
MSKKINIGFVGVGQIAQQHLAKYRDIPGANVVAAADINEQQLNKVAEKFDIPETYSNFREMLKNADIQAVDVCVHNNLHMPVTVECLKAGKDVYCEKPLAGTYTDAEKMVKVAKQLKRKLSMQLGTLFSTSARVAKKLIDEGQLGKIYHGRATGFRRRGRPYVDGYGTPQFVQKQVSAGGALYDMGVYHIAAMLHLMGNPEIDRVSGKTYQETPLDPRRKKLSGYNVEELGLGFVRFKNGASMDVIESWAVHMGGFEGSSVFGSKGGIRLEPFGFFHQIGDMDVSSEIDLDGAAYRWSNVYEDGGIYDSPQKHWIAALQGKCPLLPTAALGLNTMMVSEAIFQSEKLGREVTASEVRKLSKSTAAKV